MTPRNASGQQRQSPAPSEPITPNEPPTLPPSDTPTNTPAPADVTPPADNENAGAQDGATGTDTADAPNEPTPNPLEQPAPAGEPPRLEIRKFDVPHPGAEHLTVEREYLVAHLPLPESVPTLSVVDEMQQMIKEGRWPVNPVEAAQLLAEMAQKTLTTGAVEAYSTDHRRHRAMSVWRELDSMARSLRRVVDEMIAEFNEKQPVAQRVGINGDGQLVLAQDAIQAVQSQPHKPRGTSNGSSNVNAASSGDSTGGKAPKEDTRYATYEQTLAWAKATLGIDRLFVMRRYTPRNSPDQTVTVYLEWAGASRWIPAAWDGDKGRIVPAPWNIGDPVWTTLNAADQHLVDGSPVSVYAAYLTQIENAGRIIPQHKWNEAKRGGAHNIMVQLRIVDEQARAFHAE